MASSYSTKFRFELIATGEQASTWGITTNTNLGTLIEQAIAGVGAISFGSDADKTLSTSNGSTDEARNAVYSCTSSGSLTATRALILPAGAGVTKTGIAYNGTTGGQSILVKPSGGTGVTVPNGYACLFWSDGTNCYQASPFLNLSTGAIALGSSAISQGTWTGALNVTGDFTVATNKFTVANGSGNTAIAGTLGVTGNATFSGTGAFTGNLSTQARLGLGGNYASPAGTLDIGGNYCISPVAVSASAVDLSAGNYFSKTIAADTTFTFTNTPSSRATGFVLELTNAGSKVITWPGSVKWPGGAAPTLTSSGVDVLVFLTRDGGTTWRGILSMRDSK